MSRVELPAKRHTVARVARAAGDGAWWVFVVGLLIAEMETSGIPRRYADYYTADSLLGTGLGQSDFSSVGYGPLADQPPSRMTDLFDSANLVASVATVALAVTVIAAVVEAVVEGRRPAGIATIVAPIFGSALIFTALHYRHGMELQLNLAVVFVLVLIGVAVREVWSRAWAPRPLRGA